MQYINGKVYEIVTPTYGALLFKYNAGKFESVDKNGNELRVRIFKVANNGDLGAAQVGRYTIYTSDLQGKNYSIGAVDDWKILKSFTSPTVGEGMVLNVDPRSERYSSGVMQAIMEDPTSLVLYTCVQAMMPYMVTMANATRCLSSTQISFDMISMRHSQSIIQKQIAMERMMEEIRNSKLMKFLSSPWFAVILVLAALLIAVLCVITGGAAAVVISVVIATVVAVALVTTVSVLYTSDKNDMEKLKEELGYTAGVDMPSEIQKLYDKAQQALDVAFSVAIVMIVISAVSMAYGGATAGAAVEHLALQLAQNLGAEVATEAMTAVAKVLFVVGLASAISSGATAVVSGIHSIVEGLVMQGTAAIEYAINKVRAEVDALSAISKFFKELMSRMEQSMKILMETFQDLIKNQGEIIKTMGEGSRMVTRNIAGI
jgi:hypothetical protein